MKTWREEVDIRTTNIDDIWKEWKPVIIEVAKETIGQKTIKRSQKKKIYMNKEERKKRNYGNSMWKKEKK